jgi:entry exclusion lipoprotein TrbK
MHLRKALTLALAAALAVLAAGCDNKPALQAMPEVNDENCKLENIQKIEEKGMQQEFAGKCARRGTFKPSEPKKW